MCRNSNSIMKSDSAIGQHLINNPECTKTYSGDNFRTIGQARSSCHLNFLESLYIETQTQSCRNKKEFIVSLGLFKYTMVNRWQVVNHVYLHLAIYFGSSFGRYPTFHTLTSVRRNKNPFQYV